MIRELRVPTIPPTGTKIGGVGAMRGESENNCMCVVSSPPRRNLTSWMFYFVRLLCKSFTIQLSRTRLFSQIGDLVPEHVFLEVGESILPYERDGSGLF